MVELALLLSAILQNQVFQDLDDYKNDYFKDRVMYPITKNLTVNAFFAMGNSIYVIIIKIFDCQRWIIKYV